MKKKNRILVLGLTFSMVISSGLLTGCDSAAGNKEKKTTGVEYEGADYELSEESSSEPRSRTPHKSATTDSVARDTAQ